MNKIGTTNWPKDAWDRVFLNGKTYWQLGETDLDVILAKFPSASTALDMGCGSGELAFQLARRGLNVDASDFSVAAIGRANEQKDKLGLKNVSFHVSDMERASVEKEYDLVFLKLAFAFVQNKKAFLKRIKKSFLHGLVIITPVIDDSSENPSEKIVNISVPRSEMDRLLGGCFGIYEVLHGGIFPDGSNIQIFIAKKT